MRSLRLRDRSATKTHKMLKVIFCAFCAFLWLNVALAQQAANATLTGTIVDTAGALVPNAKLTATHTATGVHRETLSNEDGLYVFSNMPPGSYELRIEATGFGTQVFKSVSLKVGQTLTFNLQLDVELTRAIADPTEM